MNILNEIYRLNLSSKIMTTEYTKEQRHEIYKKILKDFLEDQKEYKLLQNGICYYIILDYNQISYFPEFLNFKPVERFPNIHGANVFWFPADETGIKKRIEILKECIELTKP